MFGSVGRIERFYLARDKPNNKPKGFAFITYTNRNDAETAIERFRYFLVKKFWEIYYFCFLGAIKMFSFYLLNIF